MDWKVVASSVSGRSHLANGTPCQDAFYWLKHDGVLIAVVCDGAGSAADSDFGAEHGAKTICEEVLIQFSITDHHPDREELEFWIRTAIKTARNTLPGVISDEDMLRYHATVVGVIITDEIGLFFHIGDGLAMAVTNEQWQDAMISKPENGKSATKTFFYTEPHWYKHLRFTEISLETDIITLMSDGAMSFVTDQQVTSIDPSFIIPVDKFLQETDSEKGSEALTATLKRQETHAVTSDDKTLLWARRTED